MAAQIPTQVRDLPLLMTAESCAGGTYIVTGANTGLGYEAAKHLVALGAAKVILGVRNLTAGETAKANIVKDTGKTGTAEVWALDLSSYDSVKAFANKAIAELDRIDAIIENAAVATGHGKAEGHSMCLTVNVLSTFLLGMLLFSKLIESARNFGITPHLTIVTSGSFIDTYDQWNEVKDNPLVKMDKDDIGMALLVLKFSLRVFPLVY
jgi:NAD(P)-dependent dehydrogenase (short-subunit alcohol dehydrogenase family)